MKLAFLQLLLVAHATSSPSSADTWNGEVVYRTYQPTPPTESEASLPNHCQNEGFLRSAKRVLTSSFKLDETFYCESGKYWQTSTVLDPYELSGVPVDPDDATFHFPVGNYVVTDDVPTEELTFYAKYSWSCTTDGRMKRNSYPCSDSNCTGCDMGTNHGVTYDAGTSAIDFGPDTGEDFGPEYGVCIGMELEQPPEGNWAKWHSKAISGTTTSGDFSVSTAPLPSCDGNGNASAPLSGLHLSAGDAKIMFGPNGECEIRLVPGESKLTSTCEIVVESA